MVKPLLDTEETAKIVTASMSTVHAATNTQSILDGPPKAGTKDLRRNRSVFNNIIPTSTGAAIALEEILPEIKKVGFMADSIRVPNTTVSSNRIESHIQNITRRKRKSDHQHKDFINDVYKKAAEGPQKDLLDLQRDAECIHRYDGKTGGGCY